MRNAIKALVGTVPDESGNKKRIRIHQGWWRTFVLCEKEGLNPVDTNKNVCNTILNGEISKRNFLTQGIVKTVELVLKERTDKSKGKIETNRVYNNLLSSQPLCFNFFGELKQDLEFAKKVMASFYPDISEVTDIFFEFAPEENYTNDNSAFDVAIECIMNGKKSLIGFECKYTDLFSDKEYDKNEYREIYHKSNCFKNSYSDYINKKYNQLFRNQLIAEALAQNSKYDQVLTGLFCYNEDTSAIDIGNAFQEKLNNGVEVFKTITYKDFIIAIQKCKDISWEQRKLSMLLWARYCGLELSDGIKES